MSYHSDYMRRWRREHGMIKGRAHDPLPSEAELQRRGQELAALMMAPLPRLNWPSDLFSQKAMMAQALQQQSLRADDVCSWEACGRAHRQNIPMTIPSPYGHGFSVRYFCCDAHKSEHVKKHGRA